MNRSFVLVIVAALILTGCGQIKADVPKSAEAKATQGIIEKYIHANQNYDADLLMTLYSDKIAWWDNGVMDGPFDYAGLDYMNRTTFKDKSLKLKFNSYQVSSNGRYAVLQAVYSSAAKSSGNWVSVNAVAVLEFNNGKIVKETWYYNGDPFQ